MYYRIAIQSESSPTWRWVSTPLGSVNSVMQWLLFYRAFPRDRLRIFESASREDLSGQQLPENSGMLLRVTPAAKFLTADTDRPRATKRGTPNAAQETDSGQALENSSESFLDRRRSELECGAGGDHDLPYRFSMPASIPQVLAWARLLTRVEHGDLHTESIPIGAPRPAPSWCDCTRRILCDEVQL
jgi:hypothetical protein